MRTKITQKLLPKLKPETKVDGETLTAPYEIRDTELRGLIVRVQPSGARSYIVQYGRGKRVTLGSVDVLLLTTARDRARQILNAAHDDASKAEIATIAKPSTAPDALTLRTFLTDHYTTWLTAHNKRGAQEAERLAVNFADWLDRPLAELNSWIVEKWRTERLKAGRKPATINRILAPLIAACGRAKEWKLIEENPLAGIKPLAQPKADAERVRYLSDDEDAALRKALLERDERKRAGRQSGNAWREERGQELLPAIGEYADALTPLVTLSLNTGARRGELFSMRWSDVDLGARMITIRAATAKGNKTRKVPLNNEALRVLKAWKKQTGGGDALVFPGLRGGRLTDVKKAWKALLEAASIQAFRWHDMRHDFASKLVMRGVDLNVVRELLGHADLTMTLRYSHLSPAKLADAVSRLSAPAPSAAKQA